MLFILKLQDNERDHLIIRKQAFTEKERKNDSQLQEHHSISGLHQKRFHVAGLYRCNHNCNKILEFVWKSDATNISL